MGQSTIQKRMAPGNLPNQGWMLLMGLTTVASAWACVYYDRAEPILAPLGLLLLWFLSVDFPLVFFLMLTSIPLSVEVRLPGGFGTDLPSEPLMWLLTLVALLWFLRYGKKTDARFVTHPITLALFLHLSWTVVCMIASQDFVVSLKFLLAKSWYVIVFYFLAGYLLGNSLSYRRLLWFFFIPLLVVVVTVLTRHAAKGFAFNEVNHVMGPFFRNKVMYACILAVFLPFVWYGVYWYRRYSSAWWILVAGIVLFLIGINFAYTRAAYVALLAAVGMYWCMRWKSVKLILLAFAAVMGLLLAFLSNGDNWLLFAPDYERTVSHKRFESLLEATTKLEDISTMERVYRWVAASYMVHEQPFTGFGPGTFYFFYKKYTVSSFKTYVSANPEQSGIHNYFLMTTVEQGIPGLFFFLVFSVTVILYGERIYHRMGPGEDRRTLLAAWLCFVLINLLMLMNDLVETDKIGSLFFISAALLVKMDLKSRDEVASKNEQF